MKIYRWRCWRGISSHTGLPSDRSLVTSPPPWLQRPPHLGTEQQFTLVTPTSHISNILRVFEAYHIDRSISTLAMRWNPGVKLSEETFDFGNILLNDIILLSYYVMFCYIQLLTFIIITAHVYLIRGTWPSATTMLIFASIMPLESHK